MPELDLVFKIKNLEIGKKTSKQEWKHSCKSKANKPDDYTNIDKYRVVANITEFHFYQN